MPNFGAWTSLEASSRGPTLWPRMISSLYLEWRNRVQFRMTIVLAEVITAPSCKVASLEPLIMGMGARGMHPLSLKKKVSCVSVTNLPLPKRCVKSVIWYGR